MELRDYQVAAIADLRRALRTHKRALLQLPTGGGKTAIAAYMLKEAAERGRRAWFVVHRRELVEQTGAMLKRIGATFGFVAAGFPPQYNRAITVCSVHTLAQRLDRLPAPDLIVWDEAHHCAAGTWQRVADAAPYAYHVGLTATPERLDGRGLDHLFSALVPGPSVSWLIEQGFLSPYRAWTHPIADLGAVRQRGADFDPTGLAEAVDKPHILGDAVSHYLKLCAGKQAVAFCVNVEHAVHTRDAFRAAGVIAEEVDGKTRPDIRKRIVNAFRRGDVQVLTSVDLFGEGFDLPELHAAILLRPTQSLGLYLQQVGRALRAAPGKDEAIILDHAGNIERHGLPDAARDWQLAGRKKRSRKQAVKTCPSCFGTVAAAARTCDYCGHSFVTAAEREIEQRMGELEEVRRSTAARSARTAETFGDLVDIALARGHRSPHRFAAGVFKSRGLTPTPEDYAAAVWLVQRTRNYKKQWAMWELHREAQRLAEQGGAQPTQGSAASAPGMAE